MGEAVGCLRTLLLRLGKGRQDLLRGWGFEDALESLVWGLGEGEEEEEEAEAEEERDGLCGRRKERRDEKRSFVKTPDWWNKGVRTGRQEHMIPTLSSAVL